MANAQSVTDDTDPALITIDLTDVNEVLEAFYAWLADSLQPVSLARSKFTAVA